MPKFPPALVRRPIRPLFLAAVVTVGIGLALTRTGSTSGDGALRTEATP